jgi:hypothetical protein
MKIKASNHMIQTVLKVKPADRMKAIRIAETTFMEFLNRLEQFGDYDRQTNMAMASDAAVAEVEYQFGIKYK